MAGGFSRREFLRRSAGVAAGFAVPAIVSARALGAEDKVAASERIQVGMIGMGGMNGAHLGGLLGNKLVDVVAVCDVDSQRMNEAKARVGDKCAAYQDFRKLLEQPGIDAVWIATPDHWHTLTSIAACQAGKDVYCEKPLTLTIEEGKTLVRTVRQYGRVFQTGSQQRSEGNFRYACELARSGKIGKLKQITTGIGGGPTSGWQPDEPPPPGLDWDMWLGPAPYVPFNPLRHPYNFRWFYDYSGGKMTDWGAHHNDIGQWGHGMDGNGPIRISGTATFPDDGLFDTATDFTITYEYADGVPMICAANNPHGIVFEGSAGKVWVDRGFLESDPVDLIKQELGPDDVHLYESPGHHANFLDCIKTRERPICDVEVGHRSITVCHLGNIAIRSGRVLEWDPVTERITNDPELNRWLHRPYRAPWVLP
jgi:predicted dehydrogenase